jgi:hypothetical protein
MRSSLRLSAFAASHEGVPLAPVAIAVRAVLFAVLDKIASANALAGPARIHALGVTFVTGLAV